MSDVTQLLNTLGDRRSDAREQLLEVIYRELRAVAGNMMARESPGHTLQATALVHEAWLRLGGGEKAMWKNRAHFFGAAGEAMRRILIDQARRRQAARRGGGMRAESLDEVEIATEAADDEVFAVHEALDQFARSHPRKAELVKLRYFVGMNLEQAAAALEISEPTAKRDWSYARAWLGEEIRPGR
jgi:RNA polymerase sigma factor (TIGR02999 family)